MCGHIHTVLNSMQKADNVILDQVRYLVKS